MIDDGVVTGGSGSFGAGCPAEFIAGKRPAGRAKEFSAGREFDGDTVSVDSSGNGGSPAIEMER